jgi:hypothetical protein
MTAEYIPPSVPLYLTPDSIPSGVFCRTLGIPNDPTWTALVDGALTPLMEPDAWRKLGALTPQECADAWRAMLYASWQGALDCDTVPAPFWDEDSGDDTPTEAPASTQDWYGRWDGETFLESVSYVFLSSFLASLIGAQAAIKYLTIPRAFRVLIRQNPHGANLLLFLDGGLYKVINGYSPVDKIAEFLIASPGSELMLVVDSTHDPDSTPNAHGDYVVDVIRTRLTSDDVVPPFTRYDGTPPVYQTSYDDGVTYYDTPSSDVRHAPFARFPPLAPYDNARCDAAARMTAQLKEAIHTMCVVTDAAQAVTDLLEIIILPSGLVGLLLDLFFTVCNWIIDNGQAVVLAAMTDAVYDDIECALFCFVAANGSITQTNLDSAWEKAKAEHPGTVATVIDEVRFIFTDNIFSNADVKRTETGTCDSCDCTWCYQYLWQECEADSWSSVLDFSNTLRCDATPHFWQGLGGAAPAALGITASSPLDESTTHVTGFTLEWALDDAQGAQDQVVRFYDHIGGTLLYAWDSGIGDHGNTGGTQTVHITGLDLHVGAVALVAYAHDYAIAFNFSIEGDGANPFPDSNCT